MPSCSLLHNQGRDREVSIASDTRPAPDKHVTISGAERLAAIPVLYNTVKLVSSTWRPRCKRLTWAAHPRLDKGVFKVSLLTGPQRYDSLKVASQVSGQFTRRRKSITSKYPRHFALQSCPEPFLLSARRQADVWLCEMSILPVVISLGACCQHHLEHLTRKFVYSAAKDSALALVDKDLLKEMKADFGDQCGANVSRHGSHSLTANNTLRLLAR